MTPDRGDPPSLAATARAAAHSAQAEALRYVLARMDESEGRRPDIPADCLSPSGMVALAMLVTGARRAMAQERGVSDPAEQASEVRSMLFMELESAEMGLAFARVEAEMDGG